MKKDIYISNGLLFTRECDTPPTKKNVLIQVGRIAQISENEIPVSKDTHIIDAIGKWIAPGFLDTHTHYDGELLASPGLKESARHGVTSIILGSCSVSAIYNDPEDTVDSFTRVEAISTQ